MPRTKLKDDLMAAVGEFVGTTMFLFLALGSAKTAIRSQTQSQTQTTEEVSISNPTLIYIATGFGLSLIVTAFMFYRITGALFNPQITFALWLIGAVPGLRAIMLVISQLVGGIAGAALVAALTPFGGVADVETKLASGVNIGQGLFLEAFLTAVLVFSVLMLAAEKSRATYLAPLIIGLTLFVCHLFGIEWTGCGMNTARSLGPAVVEGSFQGSFWIYVVGPFIGSLLSVGFYTFLKTLHYENIVFGQDDDKSIGEGPIPVHQRIYNAARRNRRFVLFTGHSGHSAANGATQTANGVNAIDHAEKGQAQGPKVVPFDKEDAGMMDAIRSGEATVFDVPSEQTGGPSAAGDGAGANAEGGPGRGGIGAPGASKSGLAKSPKLEALFRAP